MKNTSQATETSGFEGIYQIIDAALYFKATMTSPTSPGTANRPQCCGPVLYSFAVSKGRIHLWPR